MRIILSDNPSHGDIYWANLEPVKGSEQSGHRPVFIASNNLMNKHSPVILIIPMTSKGKISGPFEIPYNSEDLELIDKNITKLREMGHRFNDKSKNTMLLCQQSRSIAKERLVIKIGSFKSNTYTKKVKSAISFLYAINGCINCQHPMRINSLKCHNCGTTHNKKCSDCRMVSNVNYKFCPHCGKEARNRWINQKKKMN